ncbi:MAG TPA: TonB family protein [Opitutaceae bacterium]|nr:TonB family protein [Opitutaceae bacterium]
MQDDAALLWSYAETRSNEPFAELVRRHLDLVYSAALRQVAGDTHLAEDVTQAVFADLARKAAAVASCPVLAGWLHTSTHYAAAKAVRTEQRRRAREQEAHTMHDLSHENSHDAEWAQMRPVLDDAIRQLTPKDRDAILLRFFEGQAFAAIGTRFGLAENAARMRVERALDKLRAQLARRGINSTTAALATVLVSQAVVAAPATLATTVTSGALVSAAGAGAVVSFFQLMAITKTQIAVAGALLIAGGGAVVTQQKAQAQLREEVAALNAQNAAISQLRETNAQLSRANAAAEAMQAAARQLPALRSEIAELQERSLTAARAPRPAAAQKAGAAPAAPGKTALSGDRPPTPTQIVGPKYPFEMRAAGISGEAVVSLVINSKGEIQDARIARSTHREFEEAALAAARQWKFDPGQKGGRVINTRMEVPIVFQLEEEDPNWF